MADYSGVWHFQGEMATRRHHCTQTVKSISEAMAYIIDQSGDFQQGGYLYKPPEAFNGYRSICECLTCLRRH